MESDMGVRPRRAISAAVALLGVGPMAACGAGAAGVEVAENNVPSRLPGNVASLGPEATSSSAFGAEIELAGKARTKPTLTVVMSSWACETGGVYEGTCKTLKKKGFHVPVTVRVYNAAELEEGPVAEKTKNVKM